MFNRFLRTSPDQDCRASGADSGLRDASHPTDGFD